MILMKYFTFFYYFLKINTQIMHRHQKKYTVKGLKGVSGNIGMSPQIRSQNRVVSFLWFQWVFREFLRKLNVFSSILSWLIFSICSWIIFLIWGHNVFVML